MESKIVCKECSSEISATDAFCPFCGIKIDLPQAEATAGGASQIDLDATIVGFALSGPEQQESGPANTAESVPLESGRLATPGRTMPTVEDVEIPSEITSQSGNIEAQPQMDPVVPENLQSAWKPDDAYKPQSELIGEKPLFDDQSATSAGGGTENSDATGAFARGPVVLDELVSEPPPPAVLSGELLHTEARFEARSQLAGPEDNPSSGKAAISEPPSSQEPFNVLPVDPVANSAPEPEPTAISISKPLEELPDPHQEASIFDSVRIMEGNEFALPTDADQIATMIPGISGPVASTPAVHSGDAKPSVNAGVKDTGIGDSGEKRAGKLKPLPEGTILNNRYEIIRKIGGGGMGAVYLASDNNLGGVLRAVKEMVQSHIEEDQQEKAINDFKRESMILSTLDHPSIPTIFDYFFDAAEGRFYLVMKYISGGDLASKLRSAPEGRIDELSVTEWAIQITDVLNYLHNQPSTIVYRDLKPSNIMLDGNSGRVMLIDFGIARSISQKEEKGVTAVGTMGYAPPELFSGNVEPRSDIYSLGSTMFHLLTGADPQSNPLLIFDFQKNPRPRQINPRLSDQMERILMRAVEYNAEARFSSAAEMKAVLEEHLANLRSGNVTYGTGETPVAVSLANQMVFCGFCGQRIVATDLFCAFCGAKQPLAQKGVHSEIYQKPAATARLVVEGTSDLSAPVFVLQKDENLIGRRDPVSNIFPEVDLSKYDPQTKISRRHARIWREGTDFLLEDLGSSNGTSIETGGAKIFRLPPRQPYKLSAGDKIRIGDARLHFVVG